MTDNTKDNSNDTKQVFYQEHWKKNVSLFLGGQAVTLIGSSLVSYAIMWHVTLETGSGSVMTLFVIATMLPLFIVSPFAGIWADRFNRKYIINIADLSIAAVTLIIAVCFTMGITNIGLLFVCAIIRSAGQGIQMPAVTALIPQITPKDQLVRINGINMAIQSLSMLGSPALAGFLLTIAPMQIIFYVDVVTALVGVFILFFLVKNPKRSREEVELANARSYFTDLKDGIRYIRDHVFIKRFIVIAIMFNILLAPAMYLSILQVTRNFGPDVWRLSAVEICFSVGMMLGGIIIAVWGGFRNKTVTCFLGVVVFGLSTVGLGVMGVFIPYLICIGISGLAVPAFNTPMAAIFQTKIDENFMGRVMSVLAMISSLAVPLGMLVFGPLGDKISIDLIMIITGGCTVVVSIYFLIDKKLMEAGR